MRCSPYGEHAERALVSYLQSLHGQLQFLPDLSEPSILYQDSRFKIQDSRFLPDLSEPSILFVEHIETALKELGAQVFYYTPTSKLTGVLEGMAVSSLVEDDRDIDDEPSEDACSFDPAALFEFSILLQDA